MNPSFVPQKVKHQHRRRLRTILTGGGPTAHDLEIMVEEVRFGEAVERVRGLGWAVTVLVDPDFLRGMGVLGCGVVEVAEFLGADVLCDVA